MLILKQQLKTIIKEETHVVLSEVKGPFLKAKVIKALLKKIRAKLNVPFHTSDVLNRVRDILRKAIPPGSNKAPLRISEGPEDAYVVSLLDLHKAIMDSRTIKDGEISPQKIDPDDAWNVARLLSSWLEKQKGANITVEKTRSLLGDEETPAEETPAEEWAPDPAAFDAPTEETPTEETPTEEPSPEEDKDIQPLTQNGIARFFQKLIEVHYKSDRAPTDNEEVWSAEEPINYINKETPLLIKMFAKTEYLEQKKLLKEYENWFEKLRAFHKQRGKEALPEELMEKVEELLEAVNERLTKIHKEEMRNLINQLKVQDISKKKWDKEKKRYVQKTATQRKVASRARAALTRA
jgi:hypothetical protein